MINLDQVKLLDAKVISIIEKATKLTENNLILTRQNEELKTELEANQKRIDGFKTEIESNQKRIDELEVLVTNFREDQAGIEETILATLDKINKFGELLSKNLKKKPSDKKNSDKKTSEKAIPLEDKSQDNPQDNPIEDDIIDPLGDSSLDEEALGEETLDEETLDEEFMNEETIDEDIDEESIYDIEDLDLIDESEDPADDGDLDIF